MKVLRIKLRQSQASYAKEETVKNRMTYPLPAYSTIIGALHAACGYDHYHQMDISVQGKFESMQRKLQVNYTLLNHLEDDRSTLIWLENSNALSNGYIEVAKALKKQGNSFRKGITIQAAREDKIQEYRSIKDRDDQLKKMEKEEICPIEDLWKAEKKRLKQAIKDAGKKTEEGMELTKQLDAGEERVKKLRADFKEKREREVVEPLSHFGTLTKGVSYQEVLSDVELVIHVHADEEVMQDILKHKFDLVALGRSEDFIELEEIKEVELTTDIDQEYTLQNGYSMYVNYERIDEGTYFIKDSRKKMGRELSIQGTLYEISKNYEIQDKKRVFQKISCLYTSTVAIDSDSTDAWFDRDGGYIVDLN